MPNRYTIPHLKTYTWWSEWRIGGCSGLGWDDFVAWTKHKWYRRLTVLLVLTVIGIMLGKSLIPLRMGLVILFIVLWYIFLILVIEDIKTKIMTGG